MLCEYLGGKGVSAPVLLQGPWGCGKTYLIHQICEDLKSKNVFVRYVSLNGVSSRAELDERLIEAFLNRSLTNMLTMKALRYGGEALLEFIQEYNPVVKKVAKSVKKGVRDVASQEAKDGPLVFDDLERCEMPLPEMLGYLEHLLETFRVPIVYVCNEKRLVEKDKNFLLMKEKLVGQTYTLVPDADSILPAMVKECDPLINNSKTFTDFCSFLIEKTFVQIHEYNYRAFQSALWQLSFWVNRLKSVLNKNKELTSQFSCLFMALAYPTQLGKLTDEGWNIDDIARQQSKEELKDKKLCYTYYEALTICAEFSPELFGTGMSLNTLLAPKYWQGIINLEFTEIDKILLMLNEIQERSHPVWEPLFRFRFKDDQTTQNAKRAVIKALRNREIVDAQEIRMVFGLMESYAHARAEARNLRNNLSIEDANKFWKRWQDAIYLRFQHYVDTLLDAHLLDLTSIKDSDVCLGHGVPGASRPTESLYENIRTYLLKIYEKRNIEQRTDRLHNYLKTKDLIGISTLLLEEANLRKPVLCLDTSGIEAFFQTMTHADMNALLKFNDCLHKRYYIRYSNRQEHLQMFQEEQETWQRLSAMFEKRKTDIYKEHAYEPLWIITLDRLIEMIHNKLIIPQSSANSETK